MSIPVLYIQCRRSIEQEQWRCYRKPPAALACVCLHVWVFPLLWLSGRKRCPTQHLSSCWLVSNSHSITCKKKRINEEIKLFMIIFSHPAGSITEWVYVCVFLLSFYISIFKKIPKNIMQIVKTNTKYPQKIPRTSWLQFQLQVIKTPATGGPNAAAQHVFTLSSAGVGSLYHHCYMSAGWNFIHEKGLLGLNVHINTLSSLKLYIVK